MGAFRFRLGTGVPPFNVAEWRERARRRLPEVAWSYIDGGADDRLTLSENVSSFRRWRLRMRSATGVNAPDLATSVAGTEISLPLALAPIGAAGLAHWTAEPAAARAAESCGTRLVLSTASSYRLEEVAEATQENHWFQLYPMGGRERIGLLIDRARAAGYTALFVTVDVPAVGNREGERRWNFTLPWTVTPRRALHMLRHWQWVYEALRHKRIAAIHFLDEAEAAAEAAAKASGLGAGMAQAEASKEALLKLLQSDLSWDDVRWMRERWKGPLYIKGILDPDDAAFAVDDIGADGVVVSNHGGRQLDRSLATIDALPAIVGRIGERAEVFLDGGIRRGTDVITALALGAKAVFVGRPFLYGLAAEGESGVRAVIETLREELRRDLLLMGCPSVSALDRSWLIPAGVR
ncbi:MAG: alpha-hydroxy-acid oxidizing protein [Novosphingobium sp.]|nr:alpha-hydroxy-acid oxidizing protein [Novosphingobium sp.]MCP5403487.1 alpha-hydroxy-acid oxidizing protein [Novosphingobium sp.]